MHVTKEDVEAAVGTPQETSTKLSWTLQCYGNLERKHAERGRELRAVQAQLERAIETRENANAVSVRVEMENKRLREFVRAFRGWQTTADLNELARDARVLDEEQA